ncbi:oleosin H2-like [Rutidosis leptorrhynchoides]|uniref:oleosin H2-like n=1 Tax=Rutidosis leptorrhynchoides TaxID=125765 RepID=UPI003A990D56
MDTTKSRFQQKTTTKLLAILTLFPITGFFIVLSSLMFTATFIGLTIATPIFVLFSPILVPGLLTIGFAVTGFIASGAFGISALSSLSYIVNYFKKMRSRDTGEKLSVQDQLDYAKRRARDTAGYVDHQFMDVDQWTQRA